MNRNGHRRTSHRAARTMRAHEQRRTGDGRAAWMRGAPTTTSQSAHPTPDQPASSRMDAARPRHPTNSHARRRHLFDSHPRESPRRPAPQATIRRLKPPPKHREGSNLRDLPQIRRRARHACSEIHAKNHGKSTGTSLPCGLSGPRTGLARRVLAGSGRACLFEVSVGLVRLMLQRPLEEESRPMRVSTISPSPSWQIEKGPAPP